ncbi:uncharacterized protein LOC126375345 [Pectinophora gossypiella]|uniref:uncharacterized protein LOC126375345 n=1 Tax=Pectinophora gossypiella TaxID=13191 RepID=UPI00214E20E7|nr:uncharacterized protein LOC126375345 [Pectinophora gossypiella]
MDPERQPLLGPRTGQDVRCRRFRPLSSEEVLTCRQEATWRRWRFFVVIMFWAIMAMFLSSIATILLQAPRCPVPSPSVAPVHLNFAPLIATTSDKQPAWMT